MENLQGFAETLLRSYIALATSEISNFFIWMFRGRRERRQIDEEMDFSKY